MMTASKGYTLMHEHITIDLSGQKQDEDCRLDCFSETIQELQQLYALGVRRILDVTNLGMGRNPKYVQAVAEATGIEILMGTGFYKEPFLPAIVYEWPEEALVDFLVREVEEGVEDTGLRPRALGEFGTSRNEMTEAEAKVFRVMIHVARKTGLPVSTHTTLGTLGVEQAEKLLQGGLDPTKIVIGHMDLAGSVEAILRVVEMGVTVGFDTIGKNQYTPDSFRVEALQELRRRGYLGQVVCSMDITRKSHLASRGGLGYSHLFTHFLPSLREVGFSEKEIDQLLIENPHRILDGERGERR